LVPVIDGYITQEEADKGMVPVMKVRESYGRGGDQFLMEANEGGRPMNGGNFAHSSDSRFGETYGQRPLAIFDRFDG